MLFILKGYSDPARPSLNPALTHCPLEDEAVILNKYQVNILNLYQGR